MPHYIRARFWLLSVPLLLTSVACGSAPAALPSGPVPEPVKAPAVETPAVEPAAPVESKLLGGAEYDLPIEANTWVEAELEYLVGQRRDVVARWIAQGAFYEPFVKGVLREQGIPTDLFHLAMIESGFNPTARSRAGAVGMWQFMPATGRGMGLRVDSLVDERMDPVRSTYAAARHLRDLYAGFNNWPLAAAAYNAGSGRISRGLQGIGATNFWELAVWGDLAAETRQYVPRLYAVTIIARDPERFGVLSTGQPQRFAYDSVRVDFATPLPELARLSGTDPALLTRLNPHLLRGSTPPNSYWVWVPRGTGTALRRAYAESGIDKYGGFASYPVRRGDNVENLALRTGISADRLREMNPGINLDRPKTGSAIIIPANAIGQLAALSVAEPAQETPAQEKPATAKQVDAKPATAKPVDVIPASTKAAAAKPASAPPSAEQPPKRAAATAQTHTVAAGETLWAISRRYGVDVAALEAANELQGAVIRPGQTLRIPAAAASPAAVAPTSAEPHVVEHTVRGGDTLWSIARQYDSSVDAIRDANGLGDATIRPGQTLVIPR